MSKKVIKLTESQLKNIVERVINSQGTVTSDVKSKTTNKK